PGAEPRDRLGPGGSETDVTRTAEPVEKGGRGGHSCCFAFCSLFCNPGDSRACKTPRRVVLGFEDASGDASTTRARRAAADLGSDSTRGQPRENELALAACRLAEAAR